MHPQIPDFHIVVSQVCVSIVSVYIVSIVSVYIVSAYIASIVSVYIVSAYTVYGRRDTTPHNVERFECLEKKQKSAI